jgi:hypothetical protein
MSNELPPEPQPASPAIGPADPALGPVVDRSQPDVVIISHTVYFYWWPVWAVGFLMAAVTYWQGHQMAFVPPNTEPKRAARIEVIDGKVIDGPRDVLVVPADERLPVTADGDLKKPEMRMMVSNSPGMFWVLTLCLLVFVTHVELRGVWSVVAILLFLLVTIVVSVLGLWDWLFRTFRDVDVHISASGYVTISSFLFILWLLMFLLYDRREYMVFSRGQLRVRQAIGLGEMVFDTRGMVVQKHRDALFRHWLLGFGSGDLTVHTSGTNARQFEMPNVLGIDRKLALIHTMLQEREVVKAPR